MVMRKPLPRSKFVRARHPQMNRAARTIDVRGELDNRFVSKVKSDSTGYLSSFSVRGSPATAQSRCQAHANAKRGGLRKLPHQHLQAIAQPTVDAEGRGRLVTAVDHAMLATRVLADAVVFPFRVVHQVIEAIVMLVGDQ